MAKAASAPTKPDARQQPVNHNPGSQASAEGGSADPADGQENTGAGLEVAGSAIDLNVLAKSHEALEQQLKFWAVSIEDTNKSWKQFGEQVASASGELVRLRASEARLRDVDRELKRYTVMHEEASVRADALDAELAQAKKRETAANERAAKFEEICEQIKERAVEIHAALQQSRANEQKLQDEHTAIKSELVELRRTAQEESAGRTAAEERIRKLQSAIAELETVHAEMRNGIARLTEENKAVGQQIPKLTAEAASWQKQFSASERENARMQSERRMQAERIGELESEIRTLRSDLASLVSGDPGGSTNAAQEAAIEAAIAEDMEDLDLVSSLDRAFGRDESQPGPSTGAKKS